MAGLRGWLLRQCALASRSGADFSSNDYLGLASSSELAAAIEAAVARGIPVGAGGSRLLRGNDPEHEALESEAAQVAARSGVGFGPLAAAIRAFPRCCLPYLLQGCPDRESLAE